jgi:two-component system chemotaxis response regulator CheY
VKFLIVDDSAIMRQAIRDVLKGLATEIHECADGAEGVEAFAKFLPDFVTMDVQMPFVNGFEATRRILLNHPSARIIIVSQSLDPEINENARRAGACHFVRKCNLTTLRSYIESSQDSRSGG